jgi:hypothetical protein
MSASRSFVVDRDGSPVSTSTCWLQAQEYLRGGDTVEWSEAFEERGPKDGRECIEVERWGQCREYRNIPLLVGQCFERKREWVEDHERGRVFKYGSELAR